MEIVYLLLSISVFLVIVITGVFIWAVNNRQFEDLEGPGHRILDDKDHDH